MASNVKSIMDVYLYRKAGVVFSYAVRDGKTIVGFILLDGDEEEKEYIIWRMRICHEYQSRGYSRVIMEKVTKEFEADDRFDVLIADYVKVNE